MKEQVFPELIDMLHHSDKISFFKSVWEKQEDGTWSKLIYTQTRNVASAWEYNDDWNLNRVLKLGVSDKEFFKRKLSGKT